MSFQPELLASLLDGIDLDRDELERLGSFVETGEDGSLRFRHALVRDAAYEGLPFRRRRAFHARVGEELERQAGDHAEEQAELLSLHYLEGQRHAEAWRYAKIAAERAEAKYALADARGFYRRALRAARSLSDVEARELAGVHEALGDASDRIGLYEEAAVAFKTARRLRSDDPVQEAKLRLKEAWIHERVGGYTASFRAARRGLRLLEGLESDEAVAERARLSAWCGSVRLSQGKYREAIEWCRRAVSAAEAVGALEPIAHASFIEDWAHVELGELELATHSAQALEIYERIGELAGKATVLNNLGMFRYFEGRWNEALELYQQGRELHEQVGDTVDAAMGTTNIGEILSDQGRLDEARSLFREALRTWSAAGRTEAIALVTSNLGRVAARAGDHDEALELYERARAMFERMGDDGEMLETDARIAECLVFQGSSERALERADRGLRDARALGGVPAQLPLLHRARGYALVQLGRFDEARAALTASMEAAQARQAEFETALTGRAFVDLARLEGELPEEDLVVLFTEALQRLGVVAVVEVPLPEAAGPSTAPPEPSRSAALAADRVAAVAPQHLPSEVAVGELLLGRQALRGVGDALVDALRHHGGYGLVVTLHVELPLAPVLAGRGEEEEHVDGVSRRRASRRKHRDLHLLEAPHAATEGGELGRRPLVDGQNPRREPGRHHDPAVEAARRVPGGLDRHGLRAVVECLSLISAGRVRCSLHRCGLVRGAPGRIVLGRCGRRVGDHSIP